MSEKKIIIAVIGANDPSADEAAMAEEVGKEIARRGAVLVCGGMGGIMEAACRGADSEGGLTIGILPGESPLAANPYVQIPITTGIGYARNAIVAKSARAVIAVGGKYGTLSEIAYALQSNIPIIGLNTWEISRNGQADKSIIPAKDPAEAVEKAFEMIGAK
jgi:uncharacterized protein (TIGR00725 family)